jgi:AbrB family looped-hinge helix DNA binding protein
MEGGDVTATVRVDGQGRLVIPQVERERLGLPDGGTLELIATPEGLLLERRRRATVTVPEDGLPLIGIDEVGTVSNVETVDALHQQRDRG